MQIHQATSNQIALEQWNNFKKGNSQSFEYLYKLYATGLYNYGSKFSKDKELIKECIQELFVNMWTTRSNLGNPEHIKNYIYKSFRHIIFKKDIQFNKNESYEETENYTFEVVLNIEESMIDFEKQQQISQQLKNAVSKLTARQKEAIFLKFYEQLSYEEIAEIMGISVKASYKIMARSLEYLRKNLSKDDLLMLFLIFNLKLFN